MKPFPPIYALCAAVLTILGALSPVPWPARADPASPPAAARVPAAPPSPLSPSPLRQQISALERQCAALQAQASTLDAQATQAARARQWDRAQALYGQAAARHQQQAQLLRRQAQALTAAGQAALAARKHAQALAADQSFLRSTAGQVAALQRAAAAPPPPRPPARAAALPKRPVLIPRPPARPALAAVPTLPVKRPALLARKPRLLPSAARRAALLRLRASALGTMAQAARGVPAPRRVRPRPSRTASHPPPLLPRTTPHFPPLLPRTPRRPLPSLPRVTPPDQPTVAELVGTVWRAAQEMTVDRAFEDAAPVLRRPRTLWTFRANGTWQREAPAEGGAGAFAHGRYLLLAGKLVLFTQAAGGARQSTSYGVSLDRERRTLTLLSSTPTGFTRTRLDAEAARPLR